jgi:hypothetical protein
VGIRATTTRVTTRLVVHLAPAATRVITTRVLEHLVPVGIRATTTRVTTRLVVHLAPAATRVITTRVQEPPVPVGTREPTQADLLAQAATRVPTQADLLEQVGISHVPVGISQGPVVVLVVPAGSDPRVDLEADLVSVEAADLDKAGNRVLRPMISTP